MSRPKFGFMLPVSGPFASLENIRTLTLEAETLGFDSVWQHEHIVWDREHQNSHVVNGSHEALREDTQPNFFEVMTTMSYLAAITNKVQLGVAVCRPVLRNPILLSKQASMVDVLSGGRFILGVGVGSDDDSKEFEVLNTPLDNTRGEITNEYIMAMKAIWTQPVASFHGKHYSFDGAEIFPKPVRGSVPIWVGGWGRPALRRAVELGDGWLPNFVTPGELAKMVEELNSIAREKGLDPRKFTIVNMTFASLAGSDEEAWKIAGKSLSIREGFDLDYLLKDYAISSEGIGVKERHMVGSPSYMIKQIEKSVEIGVSHFIFVFIYHSVNQLKDMLKLFSREVAPSFE